MATKGKDKKLEKQEQNSQCFLDLFQSKSAPNTKKRTLRYRDICFFSFLAGSRQLFSFGSELVPMLHKDEEDLGG